MVTRQKIIDINRIPTHIYQLGDVNRSSKTIVIIPGNPGLGGFYIPFAHELYKLFHEKHSILVVSQAGHSPGLKHCFTLNEQIEHKCQAIEQLIPNQRLILIGHSIGSYMLLKMFDRLSERIDRGFLLFPTIERMRESQAGKRFVRLYPLLIYLLPFLCFLVNIFLPFDWLKEKMISYYFVNSPVEDRTILIDTVQHDLLNSTTIRNVLQMANEEMFVVRKRPDDLIERFLDRLTFYYGENDHWVPNDIIHEMKHRYPRGDIHRCTNQYLHAFVLKHSKQLANFVFHRFRSL